MPAPSQVPRLLKHDSPRMALHPSGAAAAAASTQHAATASYHAVPAPSHVVMEPEGAQWQLEDWVCPDLQRLLQMLTGRASQAPQAELRRLRRWGCDETKKWKKSRQSPTNLPQLMIHPCPGHFPDPDPDCEETKVMSGLSGFHAG